jgi:hypothetical protein
MRLSEARRDALQRTPQPEMGALKIAGAISTRGGREGYAMTTGTSMYVRTGAVTDT